MKFFRIDLLTLLISLFILSSCKNQTGIGLDPDQKLEGSLLVDTNILVNTVLEDSVITSTLAKTPLAYINDSQIGVTESGVAVGLSLPSSTAYTPPTGTITIDSAVVVLRYADGFYGDSLTTKYKANIYQLDEKPLASKTYYNSKVWSYNPANILGSKVFNSRTHTSIKITDIVTGAKDTLKIVPAQVRIPIDPNFISNNFFGASSTVLASNSLFQDHIKGLYIALDKNQINGSGGNFMLAADSSQIDIYYRADNSGTIDTAVVSLPFSTHAASIKHTYNATVQGALASTASSANTFYIQGLGGLRTKISFPGLKNIVTQVGSDIVINRAELVISPVPGSTVPLVAQPKLSMYQLDIAHQRIPLQDNTISDKRYQGPTIFGGYHIEATNDYHFIITGYVQDLMLNKAVDYGTYIAACDTTTASGSTQPTDYLATAQTAGRVVAVGTPGKTAANYPYRIKLNIIYTKINTVK